MFVIVVDCSIKNCCEAVSTKWIPTIQRINPAVCFVISFHHRPPLLLLQTNMI